MEKNNSRTLTIVSITFIIFGAISVAIGIIGIVFASVQIYNYGFWGKFVTLILAIFDTFYGVFVVAGGILGVKRKKLDFCYKLGILLAVYSIIKIVMYSSNIFMGRGLTYFYIVSAVLSVIIPVIFVKGISREQKRLANTQSPSAQGITEAQE